MDLAATWVIAVIGLVLLPVIVFLNFRVKEGRER